MRRFFKLQELNPSPCSGSPGGLAAPKLEQGRVVQIVSSFGTTKPTSRLKMGTELFLTMPKNLHILTRLSAREIFMGQSLYKVLYVYTPTLSLNTILAMTLCYKIKCSCHQKKHLVMNVVELQVIIIMIFYKILALFHSYHNVPVRVHPL
jgi:hypothetical protein